MTHIHAPRQEQITSLRGKWFILIAAILWGTTGTAQALAPSGASVQALGALRLIGGALVLLLIAWQTGALHQRGTPNVPALLIAGIMIALYQLLFFAGVGRAGVAIGTIVGIGSAPIIAGLLDYVFEKHSPTRAWSFATLSALLGCVLLVISGNQEGAESVDVTGLLLAIGAGASYAVYTLASKRAITSQNSDSVMAIAFTIGAILLLPLLVSVDLRWLTQPEGIAIALWLGIVATGLSYIFFGRGLKTVKLSTAVTLTLAEPMTAGMLGVFIVGERPSVLALFGVLLLLTGLAILTLRQPASGETG